MELTIFSNNTWPYSVDYIWSCHVDNTMFSSWSCSANQQLSSPLRVHTGGSCSGALRILLKMTKIRPALELDRKRNVWLHSKAGFGKNTLIRDVLKIMPMRYLKWPIDDNFKWMNGYNKEHLIWIDKIDPLNAPPATSRES